MISFLKEIAQKIVTQHQRLDEVTVVFPNRRAVLYFREYLSALLTKPVFSPKLVTIEDFVSGFSPLIVADKLELVYHLYTVYNQVVKKVSPEDIDSNVGSGIEEFYFWGEMLLRDFDEIDKHLVNVEGLFKDLSHLKDLDSNFDFLTEEQQVFLRNFWDNFNSNPSTNKRKFLRVWKLLPEVYQTFKKELRARGIAYEGMLHREVAEALTDEKFNSAVLPSNVKFCGFNALTVAEEKIICSCVEKCGAEVYWDLDAYYVNNIEQEAGKFFREYQQHAVLAKTFGHGAPSNFQQKNPDKPRIKLFGAAQPIGQTKLMSQVLREQIESGMNPEETLIVLPDEKLLLPVLHGVSGIVDKLNVTMGFPLASTPMFNFIELLVDLQISEKQEHFNHRQVLALLGHPYVVAADPVSANAKRKEILKHNWVSIPKGFLATEVPLHRLVFQSFLALDLQSLIHYLKGIIAELGLLESVEEVDKEYAFYFIKFFNRFSDVMAGDNGAVHDEKPSGSVVMKSFLRLFRQLIRTQKIPFTGEPLAGLQIMGILETRNLDFKNIFVLSLNEGAFPSFPNKGSYIPYTLRKAYKLPTVEHQDAIYAYLFYRMLQRAENVFLYYNSETDVLGQGEMSRYLQQLLYESGMTIEHRILHNTIQPKHISPIVVKKDTDILQNLIKLNEGNRYFKGISPSALNTYLECRLKFYFRHVARIKEADEVEEELDARVLGNFLHEVMERFYKTIRERKNDNRIDAADLKNTSALIDQLLDQVFIEAYRLDPNKKVIYKGQRLVVREIVKRFTDRIIEMDKAYAPFTIEALEQEGLTFSLNIDREPYNVVIGGKIDRVDRKGDQIRIIDYKTGKDKLSFESIASLFSRDSKRNKAAFQTLLYAILYSQNVSAIHGDTSPVRLIPGLINRLNLFDDGFTFGLKVGKDHVSDASTLLPEFQARLKELFEELYNPQHNFDQTTDLENCQICPYTQICYR